MCVIKLRPFSFSFTDIQTSFYERHVLRSMEVTLGACIPHVYATSNYNGSLLFTRLPTRASSLKMDHISQPAALCNPY